MARNEHGVRVGIAGFKDGAIESFKEKLNKVLADISKTATVEIGHIKLGKSAKEELKAAFKNEPIKVPIFLDYDKKLSPLKESIEGIQQSLNNAFSIKFNEADFSTVKTQLSDVQTQVDNLNAGFNTLSRNYSRAMKTTVTTKEGRDNLKTVRSAQRELTKQNSKILNIGDEAAQIRLSNEYQRLIDILREYEDAIDSTETAAVRKANNDVAALIREIDAQRELEKQATRTADAYNKAALRREVREAAAPTVDQRELERQSRVLNNTMNQLSTAIPKISDQGEYDKIYNSYVELQKKITEAYTAFGGMSMQRVQELQREAEAIRRNIELANQQAKESAKTQKTTLPSDVKEAKKYLDKEIAEIGKSLGKLDDGVAKSGISSDYEVLKKDAIDAHATIDGLTLGTIDRLHQQAQAIKDNIAAELKLKEAAVSQQSVEDRFSAVGELVDGFSDKGVSPEVSTIKTKYAEIRDAIEQANEAGKDWGSETTKQINDQITELNELIDTWEKQLSLENRTQNLLKSTEKYLSDNPRVANSSYGETLRGYVDQMKSGDLSTAELAAVNAEITKTKRAAHEAGLDVKTFWDLLRQGYEKFGTWSLVTKTFTAVVRTIKKMISTVVELDTAMTELKKVTNLTADEYTRFGKQAATIAKTIGASMTDVIKSTADFARLGYSVDDAAQLAQAALVYKNVGDGITDVNVATESLISTMKAFGVQAQDSMYIVDMFNEVGNNFAISSSGIGDALVRSASALAAAGNNIQESIGLITAMNSVVQDPDAVGELCAQWRSNTSLVSMYNG